MELTLRARLPPDQPLPDRVLRRHGCGVVRAQPEELLPNPDLLAWARRLARRYDVRFALADEIEPRVRRQLARVDDPPLAEIHPGVELNPNNTGVYVTRIGNKQTCRRQEYALLRSEAIAALATQSDAAWPRADFEAIWQPLLFTMFHDAITATGVDAAHEELEGVRRDIDRRTAAVTGRALKRLTAPRHRVLSVVNTLPEPVTAVVQADLSGRFAGVTLRDDRGRAARVLSCEAQPGRRTRVTFLARAVPGLSASAYTHAPAPAVRLLTRRLPVIQNRRYRITADEHGLREIFDRRFDRVVSATGGCRPNELLFEIDVGSPWATLDPCRDRRALTPHMRLLAVEAGPGFQRLRFAIDPGARSAFENLVCRGELTVTLHEGFERVDFLTRVFWQCHNGRLRVAMPLPFDGRAVYGVPYGMLVRKAYKPTFDWTGANGDWPAIDWAGVEGRNLAVALFNRGLPSYTVEPDGAGRTLLLLSVLRSPTVPTYLHEPAYYSMTDFDGMRDEGWHTFEYALQSYDGPFAASAVVPDAAAFNAGLLAAPGEVRLPGPPRVVSGNVRLAALKCAEEGEGLILRLVEFRGRAGTAVLHLPTGYRCASRTNLLERQARPLSVAAGVATLKLRPWEIATVWLTRGTKLEATGV